MYITPEEDKPMDKEEVKPTGDCARSERQFSRVTPTGLYTNEPWHLVTPFGSQWKTIIKSHDPRVYPESESVRVALVDPASEVPVEVAEANARLIAAAPALYDALNQLLEAMEMQEGREKEELHILQREAWNVWTNAKLHARAALALVDGNQETK